MTKTQCFSLHKKQIKIIEKGIKEGLFLNNDGKHIKSKSEFFRVSLELLANTLEQNLQKFSELLNIEENNKDKQIQSVYLKGDSLKQLKSFIELGFFNSISEILREGINFFLNDYLIKFFEKKNNFELENVVNTIKKNSETTIQIIESEEGKICRIIT